MAHAVTLIPGDGVGPELAVAAQQCIDATGVEIAWDVQEAGLDALQKYGDPIPDRVLESCRRTGVILRAPITPAPAGGPRNVQHAFRQALGLYGSVRPCKRYPGIRSNFANASIDLIVIRENTEGLYLGCEFEQGSPETRRILAMIEGMTRKSFRADMALTLKGISLGASRRIARFAFDFARKQGRKKVTCVHKANVQRATDGLFLDVCRETAEEFSEIEFQDVIIDTMCMQLVRHPERFDVLVTPNLYGDILSELCAGLVGGLGVSPAAGVGEHGIVFEPTHGSAPKYKGQWRMNPTAMILAGVMLLNHLGENRAARRLESAVARVIGEGKSVTYDLKPEPNDPTAVGTLDMARAIIKAMGGRT